MVVKKQFSWQRQHRLTEKFFQKVSVDQHPPNWILVQSHGRPVVELDCLGLVRQEGILLENWYSICDEQLQQYHTITDSTVIVDYVAR